MRAFLVVERYKGDKQPKGLHPVYFATANTCLQKRFAFAGKLSPHSHKIKARCNACFFSADFYVIFYAQKYVIFRTNTLGLIAVGWRCDMKV